MWQMESVPCQKGQPRSVATFSPMCHEEHVEHSTAVPGVTVPGQERGNKENK